MMSTDQHSNLLDALYEAAGNPNGWERFFSSLAVSVPFSTAEFVLFDPRNCKYNADANYGMPTEAKCLYDQQYAAVDEWYLRAKGVVKEGWVGDGRNLCSNENLMRTEFYNDFLRPFGWLHECAAVLEMHDSAMSVLTMLRNERQREFSADEVEIIRSLVPHLKRALHLHRRMIDLQFCKEAESWALDQVPFGVVLLNSAGRVLLANSVATRMAAQRLIRLGQSGLHASCCRDDMSLQALIRSAASPLTFDTGGGALLLNACDLGCVAVLVTPIRRDTFGMAPAIAVFLTDKSAQPPSRTELLKVLFQLTPAEARLADQLAKGISIAEAADALGVTIGTARTQLKSVFRKTDTSRQAELVQLVLVLPPACGTSKSGIYLSP